MCASSISLLQTRLTNVIACSLLSRFSSHLDVDLDLVIHIMIITNLKKRGRGCADDYPIVYTRISYFYDWIVETMCVLNATGVPDYVNCDDIFIDVDIDDDDNFNFNIDYNESLSGSSSIDNDINNGTIVTETVVVAVVDDNNNATSLSSSWDSIDDNANANANDDDEEYITLIEIFTAENLSLIHI